MWYLWGNKQCSRQRRWWCFMSVNCFKFTAHIFVHTVCSCKHLISLRLFRFSQATMLMMLYVHKLFSLYRFSPISQWQWCIIWIRPVTNMHTKQMIPNVQIQILMYKYKYIWTVPGNDSGALCGSAKVARWLGLLEATAVEIGSPWLDTTAHHCYTNTDTSTCTNTNINTGTDTSTRTTTNTNTHACTNAIAKANTRTGATTAKIVSPWFDKTGRRCPFLKKRDWANESDSCLDFDHHDILFTPHILDFGRQTKMFLLQFLSYQTNVSCHRKV